MDIEFLRRFQGEGGPVDDDILKVDPELTNICWLPILNTIIEPDNWELFWRLWAEQKTFMSHNGRDTALWESLCVWKSPALSEQEIIHGLYPQKVVDWSEVFPKMFKQIFNVMPYSEIWKITLGSNIRRVPAHVDRPTHPKYEVLNPWPNSLRVVLHDENRKPTFFLTRWPQELLDKGKIRDLTAFEEWGTTKNLNQEEKCFVQLPSNTNTFVFSNGEFLHGADYVDKLKVLLLVWGRPKPEAWKAKLRTMKADFPEYRTVAKFKKS
jgi:hypothetical protein